MKLYRIIPKENTWTKHDFVEAFVAAATPAEAEAILRAEVKESGEKDEFAWIPYLKMSGMDQKRIKIGTVPYVKYWVVDEDELEVKEIPFEGVIHASEEHYCDY